MISNYEFTIIFDPDEEKTKAGMELVKDTFARYNVEITKEEDMGVRNLAYLIKKHDRGHYVYFELSVDGANVAPMSRIFQLSTLVLKFLFINPDRK